MRVNTAFTSKASKIVVAGAAASLCFATAAPALAHDTGSSSDPTKTTTAPTLAQQQAWIDARIAKSQQQLTAWAAKVAADPKLTAAQKTEWADKLAAKQSALTALKTAVDAATTPDALHAAMQADGVHGFGGWCGFWSDHHWQGGKDPARAKTAAHKSGSNKSRSHKTDPASATKPTGQTITLQAQRQTMHTVQGQNTQGKHWGGQSKTGSGDYQGRHGFGGGSSHGSHNGGSHHR